MGKVLILYHSITNHTKRMAEYLAQGASKIEGTEVRLLSIDEAGKDDIFWCNGMAVGSPTHLGGMSWKMKEFWDRVTDDIWGLTDGKIACAFSSSGGWGGGSELACLSLLVMLMNFGFLVFGVPDYVADKFTLHYGSVIAGEPRLDKEIKSCLRLGERLAQWVAFYADNRQDAYPGPIKGR
jgi:NAD(P)H dehydrogenase (quinone)